MMYATISDAINSYLASFKTWSLAILVIAAILLMVSAILQKHSIPKMIAAGVAVILAFMIALYPQDLADKAKQDFDKRSGSLAPIERPLVEHPAERTA